MWTQGNDNDSEFGDIGEVRFRNRRGGYDVNIGLKWPSQQNYNESLRKGFLLKSKNNRNSIFEV